MSEYIVIFVFMAINAIMAVIGVAVGFNVFVPVFSSVMTFQEAITFALVYFFMGYCAILYVFRDHVRWDLVKHLLPTSLAGAVLGGIFTSKLNELALTIVILGFVLYFLVQKLQTLRRPVQIEEKIQKVKGGTALVGATAGFLQGGGLGGGEIRNNYLYAKNLHLQQARGTTAIVGAVIILTSIFTRLFSGTFILQSGWLVVAAVPLVLLAALLGRYVTRKLGPRAQNMIIVGLMVFSVGLLTVKIYQILQR